MFNTVQEIVEDLKAGKMVIIVDDEARENEGDLVMLASHVTADAINFMVTHARGLVCLTLSEKRCQQLELGLAKQFGQARHTTNFTASIEAAAGVTTGISAKDRAVTIQTAVAHNAKAKDLVTPGHVFPIMARAGGVLVRAGHTEAGCDLARLAGSEPAAVIVEILNEDGTMARRDDLQKFAAEHNLKIGTIEDLIRYRVENEQTIEKAYSTEFSTAYGKFILHAFVDNLKHKTHLALVKGEIEKDEPTLVRVHVENQLHDVFSATCGHGWPLHDAMSRVQKAGNGVIVLLRETTDSPTMLEQVQQHTEHKRPKNTKRQQNVIPPEYLWAYGVGAQILTQLNVGKMRLMSAPKSFHGLAGFGLEISEYVKP